MLRPDEAEPLIRRHLACLPIESLPLLQCAGAVLRENIYAERDQPPFDRVTMDGIAVDSGAIRGGLRRVRIQQTQAAGDAPATLSARDHGIEIMTGAMLPAGCDAVIPVEQLTVANGQAEIAEGIKPAAWQNVHRRGSDARQGVQLLATGTRLRAPDLAIAASAGMARVRVSTQPAIVVISTGNELVEPGEPILPHQVRRSNVYGVVGALREEGFQRVADDHVADDADALRERLRFHLDTHDVLILSGGVSMGRMDLVPQALAELGVHQVFHKVAQRPGKPLWFGVTDTGRAVFALPGNPVSTLVCLVRYVMPAMYRAMGADVGPPERIALADSATGSMSLTVFLPVRLQLDDWARTWAVPCPTNGSGDFTSLAGTDGVVELPVGCDTYAKGFVARLYRW